MKNTIIASSLVAVVLIAGGYGLIHTLAHADVASQSAVVPSVSPTSTNTAVKDAQDTDNIQDENGGPEKPDAVAAQDSDKETNDDTKQGVTDKAGSTQAPDLPENSNDAPDAQ